MYMNLLLIPSEKGIQQREHQSYYYSIVIIISYYYGYIDMVETLLIAVRVTHVFSVNGSVPKVTT